MTALVVAMVLWLGCRQSMACDPILLELIRGQDTTSVFDSAVEKVSTKLNDVAGLGRGHAWDKAMSLLSETERDWVSLYGTYYLSKPAPADELADWKTTFDFVTRTLADVERWYKVKDFEHAHPLVRAIQDRLIRFYKVRSPDTPSKTFDRSAAFARALAEQASKAGALPRDLGESFLYLAQEISRLPVVKSPSYDSLMAKVRECDSAVRTRKDVSSKALEVAHALESYRQEALATLWFGAPGQARKEGTK